MQPSASPDPTRQRQLIALGIGLAIFGLGILMFFQFRDPMMLIFGLLSGVVFAIVASTSRSSTQAWQTGAPAAPPREVVKVRCATCRALNEESARFCSQCGKPV